MIFPRLTDPTLCTGEAGRYSIAGVALSFWRGKPVLTATDGRMLVVIPAQAEDGESLGTVTKVLPREAIAMARKTAKSLRRDYARVELNGSIEVPTKEGGLCRFPYSEYEVFPDRQTIPPTAKVVGSVCIDAERLCALQRAMGASGVRLCVHGLTEAGAVDDGLPLTVQPINLSGDAVPSPDAFGVLMPAREESL